MAAVDRNESGEDTMAKDHEAYHPMSFDVTEDELLS
jgi:hypothetical protein